MPLTKHRIGAVARGTARRLCVPAVLVTVACGPVQPITYAVTVHVPDELRQTPVEFRAGDRHLGESAGSLATFEVQGGPRRRREHGEFPVLRVRVLLPCGGRQDYMLHAADRAFGEVDERTVESWRPTLDYSFPALVGGQKALATTTTFLDNRGGRETELWIGAVRYSVPPGASEERHLVPRPGENVPPEPLEVLTPECAEAVPVKLDRLDIGTTVKGETPLFLDVSGKHCYRFETFE